MTTVTEIIHETGFDMTLDAELSFGVDFAFLHIGSRGYDSGFLLISREASGEHDQLLRPYFDWQILNWAGESVVHGDQLVHLDGYDHPVDALLSILERTEYSDEDNNTYAFGGIVEPVAVDNVAWLREHLFVDLDALIMQVREVTEHLG